MATLVTAHIAPFAVQLPELDPAAGTASAAATTPQTPADPVAAGGPFQGDGADPSLAAVLVPEQSTLDWLAYSVSLNYNRLATSAFSGFTRWHWFDPIPGTSLVLGAVPSPQLLVQLQREQCVKDIVNMCAEFQGHLETMKELGLVQCWIPTRDFHTPTLESIWIGVRFISKCEARWQELPEAERGRIYIHCKAGRGRSATVAVCWLVFCYKLTAQEAQRVLLKARAQVDKNIYLHPEVVAFHDQVQGQESNNTIVRKPWPGDL